MHKVTIRGKEYPIHLGIGTIAAIQDRYGEIGKVSEAMVSTKDVSWLFAALINDGLRLEAYELGKPATQVTEEQIATLLEYKDMNSEENVEAIVACVLESMGPEQKKTAAEILTQMMSGTNIGTVTPANG